MPSPKDILLDIFVEAEGGWLSKEELEESEFVTALIHQILATLTYFGWLRPLPKAP